MAERFGGTYLFGFGVLGTAILTFITPWAAKVDKSFLIAVRAFEGLSEGITIPAMYAMMSKWLPPEERSLLAGIINAGKC